MPVYKPALFSSERLIADFGAFRMLDAVLIWADFSFSLAISTGLGHGIRGGCLWGAFFIFLCHDTHPSCENVRV